MILDLVWGALAISVIGAGCYDLGWRHGESHLRNKPLVEYDPGMEDYLKRDAKRNR